MDKKAMDKPDEESRQKGKMRRQTSKSGSTKGRQQKSSRRNESEKEADEQTGSTRSELPTEMLTQNGLGEEETSQSGTATSEDIGGDKIQRKTSIKGMWKKAVKSLKSNDKQTWLNKKSSIVKKKEESVPEDETFDGGKDVDPVYSLLKCAADLPKTQKEKQANDSGCGGHSSAAIASSSSGVSGMPHHQPLSRHLSLEQYGGPQGSSLHHVHRAHSQSPHQQADGGNSKVVSKREHMHHIVDESLGSEFRTFYKLTSPVKKTIPLLADSKKNSPRQSHQSFDHY